MRFNELLSNNQLWIELEKRAVKDYPADKIRRLAELKDNLCGVQRVSLVLLLAPLPQKPH